MWLKLRYPTPQNRYLEFFCFVLFVRVFFFREKGKYYGKSVDWMDSASKELTLWQSMLTRPNFWVEGCIVLRPSLDNIRSPY